MPDTATATPTGEISTGRVDTPTATAEPRVATSTGTPAPTATRTQTPTRTPTATPVPTYTLNGTVTRGGQPAASVRVSVLELSLETTTGADGGFSFAGLQNTSYRLVAEDTDLTSSPLKVDTIDPQVPVRIELVPPKGGQPSLFVGQVSGNDVAGVTVRRLGGAGQTTTDANGKFWLADAHDEPTFDSSSQLTESPKDACIIAAKGHRWGFAIGPFINSLTVVNPLTVPLTQTGTPPVAATKPLMTRADLVNGATINQAVDVMLTARWTGAPTEAVGIVPQTNGFTTLDCRGNCNSNTAVGFAGFLPKGTAYTLVLTVPNSGAAVASPTWAGAQVLAYPAR